jgi:hypothetical protein
MCPRAENINCYHVCIVLCACCLKRGESRAAFNTPPCVQHFDTVFCYMGLWPSKCFLLCTSCHSLSILYSNISLVLQTILHKLCESCDFMYSWTSFHQDRVFPSEPISVLLDLTTSVPNYKTSWLFYVYICFARRLIIWNGGSRVLTSIFHWSCTHKLPDPKSSFNICVYFAA